MNRSLNAQEAQKALKEMVERDASLYRVIPGAGRNGGYSVVEPGSMGGKTILSTGDREVAQSKCNEMNAQLEKQ